MRKHKDWKDSRIQFYGLSKGDGDAGATVRLTAAQAKLSHLLSKIRITGECEVIEASLKEMPEVSTLKQYESASKKVGFDSMLPEGWNDVSFASKPNRVSRLLRLAELVAQFSAHCAKPASLVYIMLPIPREGSSPKQYCSLLAALSNSIKCPTVFIRGNHEDVLTLYS